MADHRPPFRDPAVQSIRISGSSRRSNKRTERSPESSSDDDSDSSDDGQFQPKPFGIAGLRPARGWHSCGSPISAADEEWIRAVTHDGHALKLRREQDIRSGANALGRRPKLPRSRGPQQQPRVTSTTTDARLGLPDRPVLPLLSLRRPTRPLPWVQMSRLFRRHLPEKN